MHAAAHVSSLEALVAWKADLCTFTQKAKEALSSVEMEIQRTLDWLDNQKTFWQAAVRRGEDEVFQAKNELARRRMMRIGDRPPDCTEQEQALKKALARLEYAQDRLEKTRSWLRTLPDQVQEYHGPSRQLQGVLEHDMARADALLERMINALDAYINLAPPETGKP